MEKGKICSMKKHSLRWIFFFFLGPASLELISTEFFLGFRLQLKFIGTRF